MGFLKYFETKKVINGTFVLPLLTNDVTMCYIYATMANWGLIIKRLREEQGITQEDLARLSGLKRSHISRIELGDLEGYKEDTLRSLAKAFNMTASKLTEYIYGERPSDKITTDDLIAELKERAELYEIPVVGYVAAGIPVPAEQQDMGKIKVAKSLLFHA